MGMFAVGAIALAGVIWAVTEAYEAWKNSTPEAQLEKMQEEAKKAADSFQEAKSAYEDMMNTIDKYKDQKNAL
jgi:hypothetical protein